MEYKPTYTKEEVDEVVNWFNTHRIAQEVKIGGGVSTKEADKVVEYLVHSAKTQYENRVFSGQIHMLFKLRDILIKENKVLGEK